ncbi:MAG TPA: hypothetical protein VLI90_17075, partial [Tepidisphaeraceae bacterium]|nr:hypothetical protein [Tepidisphaeraceae bacterium]
LEQEILALRPRHRDESIHSLVAEMRQLLQRAVSTWATLGSECPPTAQVFRDLTEALFKHGFLRRPPPRNLEEV